MPQTAGMRDVLGWRCKFGVMGPSTNTIVQPDFDVMRPPASPTTTAASSRPTPTRSATRPSAPASSIIGDNVMDAVK